MRIKCLIILSVLLISLAACDKNSCDDLDNGVYVYPERNDGMSLEESIELYKIPNPILECISTQGLIESCINYPEFRLMWAYYPPLQRGFDEVEAMCNGFEELWKRNDKFSILMSLFSGIDFDRDWDSYTDLENGHYLLSIMRYEVILAQDEILLDLTPSEKTELFIFMLEQQKRKSEVEQNKNIFGIVGMEASVGILSRIMYNDGFPEFMDEFDDDEYLRTQVYTLLIGHEGVITKVVNLSDKYLTSLENEE